MKGREISSLYRSHSPKMIHYNTDGNGRDQYINYNNGGFWARGVKVYMGSQRGTEVSRSHHLKPLMKHVAPFKYHSNGTGRDGYIISESGGLKRDQKALNEYHLKDFLRTPESCIFKLHLNKNGSLAKTHYVSKEQLDLNQQIRKIEKNVIDRLYNKEKPKFLNLCRKKSRPELPEIIVESQYAKTDANFFKSSIDKINSYEFHKREYEKSLNNFLHIKIKLKK